uniref:Si:ch73-335l21.4 n=1 Tax=Stegastes partitus TaxID=144197 RepID=A0A3B5BB98_9TELE
MCSEIECGVCYQTYNTGRRCPRELHCQHSFCESCLLVLSRSPRPEEAQSGADRSVICPLCRHTTSISGERSLRAELRVDECVLERLVAAGVLEQEDDDDLEKEDGEEEEGVGVQDGDEEEEEEEATVPETSGRESDSAAGSGGGRLRRCLGKAWRVISGKSARRDRPENNCLTNEDLGSLALMSCYMF